MKRKRACRHRDGSICHFQPQPFPCPLPSCKQRMLSVACRLHVESIDSIHTVSLAVFASISERLCWLRALWLFGWAESVGVDRKRRHDPHPHANLHLASGRQAPPPPPTAGLPSHLPPRREELFFPPLGANPAGTSRPRTPSSTASYRFPPPSMPPIRVVYDTPPLPPWDHGMMAKAGAGLQLTDGLPSLGAATVNLPAAPHWRECHRLLALAHFPGTDEVCWISWVGSRRGCGVGLGRRRSSCTKYEYCVSVRGRCAWV